MIHPILVPFPALSSLDMGFIHGVNGCVLRKALLGDPIELRLGTYLISVRTKEARNIEVEG